MPTIFKKYDRILLLMLFLIGIIGFFVIIKIFNNAYPSADGSAGHSANANAEKIASAASVDYAKTLYYIDPSGSDLTGNGTYSAPWRSLSKACSSVTNGIIHVNAGIYSEASSSILAAGVTLEGEGENSIIAAAKTSSYDSVIQLKSVTEATPGNQEIRFLKFDGNSLAGYSAIDVSARSNVSIHDCTFTDFEHHAVSFQGTDSHSVPKVLSENNSFYNNKVTNCAKNMTEYVSGALQIIGQKNLRIYGNTIIEQAGRNGCGIVGCPSGWTQGIYSLDDVKIFNNIIKVTDNIITGSTPIWNLAIELWDIRNVEVYNNDIQGCVDIAGHSNRDVSVHHNKVYQEVEAKGYPAGIVFESTNINVEAMYNEVRNFTIGISLSAIFNVSHYENAKIAYNKIYGIGDTNQYYSGYGIEFLAVEKSTPSNGLMIYNNTIYCNKGAMYGMHVKTDNRLNNVFILNNIILGSQGGIEHCNLSGIKIEGSGFIDYLHIKNNDIFAWKENITENLFASNRFINDNIFEDPQLASITDFHLRNTSPCISAGVPVGIKLDFENKRVSNNPTMGVYETIYN